MLADCTVTVKVKNQILHTHTWNKVWHNHISCAPVSHYYNYVIDWIRVKMAEEGDVKNTGKLMTPFQPVSLGMNTIWMRYANEGDWQMLQWRDDDLDQITLVMSLSLAIIPSRNITHGAVQKKVGKRQKRAGVQL